MASGTEGGTGVEGQSVNTTEILGACLWCGHNLMYANPGNPPADCLTDAETFYTPIHVVRDMALVDFPLVYGKFCPFAPAHPLGQFSIHQLVKNTEQP